MVYFKKSQELQGLPVPPNLPADITLVSFACGPASRPSKKKKFMVTALHFAGINFLWGFDSSKITKKYKLTKFLHVFLVVKILQAMNKRLEGVNIDFTVIESYPISRVSQK